MNKNVTIRLEEEELRAAQGIALVFDTTLSTVLRKAIVKFVDDARSAPGFEERVISARERQGEIFNLLLGAAGATAPAESRSAGLLRS